MGAAGSCLPPNSIEPRIGIENDNRLRVGPVLGTGLEFSGGRMKIAPEVRFSHHKDPNRNQVTALVGFRWGR